LLKERYFLIFCVKDFWTDLDNADMKQYLIGCALIGLIVLCCSLTIFCGARSDDNSDAASANDSVVVELTGHGYLSVLELLRETHQVDYKSSTMGVFVTGIDSIENSADYFWVYSVNDTIPEIACDRLITRQGDQVRWRFKSIGN